MLLSRRVQMTLRGMYETAITASFFSVRRAMIRLGWAGWSVESADQRSLFGLAQGSKGAGDHCWMRI